MRFFQTIFVVTSLFFGAYVYAQDSGKVQPPSSLLPSVSSIQGGYMLGYGIVNKVRCGYTKWASGGSNIYDSGCIIRNVTPRQCPATYEPVATVNLMSHSSCSSGTFTRFSLNVPEIVGNSSGGYDLQYTKANGLHAYAEYGHSCDDRDVTFQWTISCKPK